MKFTINRNEFYTILQILNKAISSNSPQPSLRGIKIDVVKDSLILTASDSEISIQKTVYKNDENELNVLDEGSILVDAKYLLEMVRKVDSEKIEIEIIDGDVSRFIGGQAEYTINGLSPNNYPNIDFNRPSISLNIKKDDFVSIINQTAFACSSENIRPILTGVNFKLEGKKLICTATNSYRLSRKVVNIDDDQMFNVTIPAKSLNELKGILTLEENNDLEINLNDKKAQFIFSDTIFQTRLLDGSYPNTDNLFNQKENYSLEVNRYDLIKAIDRSSFIKNENMLINRLQCDGKEIIISNKNQEIGESSEVLQGKFEGDKLDISFFGNYCMDAAKAFEGDTIKLKIVGSNTAFQIVDVNDDSIVEIVPPVRTYN